LDINPFNPQFGKRPWKFVGRDSVIDEFLSSLSMPNDPVRTTVLTGIRGSGKTAILSDIRDVLDENSFLIIDVTATEGLLVAIVDEFTRKGKKWIRKGLHGIKSLTAGGMGFSFGLEKEAAEIHGFRYTISEFLDDIKKHEVTTVFLIDEVQKSTPEMREFATTYQHLLRENYDVALMMAGLPNALYDVLNDDVLTFLRRSHRVFLENVSVKAVEVAFEEVFTENNRNITKDALSMAAAYTAGYPYLIQLIGYYLWKQDGKPLNDAHVERALTLSKDALYQNIHDMIFRELSQRDKEFLIAMATDERESAFGDIVTRLGVTKGFASTYRKRLIEAGIIHGSSYGHLAFTPPFTREYIHERYSELSGDS